MGRFIMGLKVLVVDDSALTRKAIKRVFDMLGLDIQEVVEAEHGLAALNILLSGDKNFDLVLTDLNMPIMNGIELIYKMRGNPLTKSIPVVVVSTESSQTRIEGLLAEGVDSYLHKPFTPEKLKEIITQTIGV
jgi:two-component system, chemotaxis family, chemotaxis protein CheY